jgi:serine phosphatase RsbU (regulator of sigma subunit)
LTLPQQAALGDRAIAEFAGDSQFVTGQLARIDLRTGTAEIVNAGHQPPLRVRDGHVEELRLEADPPFGLCGDEFRVQILPLEPGDRLVFLTDGVLERRAAEANLSAELERSVEQHPREAVQHLIQAAARASGGRLEDDATALCLDWHGGPPRDREASEGADL